MKLLDIISVRFDITVQLLMRFFNSSDTGEKMGEELDSASHIHMLPGSL
jgi:hypothetical protein